MRFRSNSGDERDNEICRDDSDIVDLRERTVTMTFEIAMISLTPR